MTEAMDPTRTGSPLPANAQPVLLSRPEVEALCLKAARGAGLSWGLAEEAGFAAGWVQAQGLDGTAALLAHLLAGPGATPLPAPGHWTAQGDAPLCPLVLGAALSDFRALPEGALSPMLTTAPVGHPLLLVPALAALARARGAALSLRWPDGSVQVAPDGALTGDRAALETLTQAALTLATSDDTPTPAGTPPAKPCAPAVLAGLNALAMKTTVPASASSREDAGAGTSDND
jgi:hypothetical protein